MQMKRYLSLTIIFLMIGCLAAFGRSRKTIVILAVNDMHASIDNMALLATVVDSVRQEQKNVIVVSSGDNRTGNPVNDKYPEICFPMTNLMNMIGFNLSALGNHEFDDGASTLRHTINTSNFRYVCSNLYAKDSLRLHVEPFKVIEIDGLRLGFLGMIQVKKDNYPEFHPKNNVGLSFTKPEVELRKYGPWMSQFCNATMLLSHLGHEKDVEITASAPYLDVIIGGHTHTDVIDNDFHNGVLVTQNVARLKSVTEIKLFFEDEQLVGRSSHKIMLGRQTPKQNIQQLIELYNNNEIFKQVVAVADEDFNDKDALGCMMSDALRQYSGANFALQNGGGVRLNSLPKGNITLKDVYALDPFGNELQVLTLTGEQIYQLLASAYELDRFLPTIPSGFTYTMDVDSTTHAIKSMEIRMDNGKLLNKKKTYTVALNSYMATVYQFGQPINIDVLGTTCTDAMLDVMRKKGHLNYLNMKRVTINIE